MPENLVTNADDVDLTVEFEDGTVVRVVAQEFSISVDQTIGSVSGISQNTPKGLTKGDLEYTWSFVVQGEDVNVMDGVSDSDGDALPFDMSATKLPDQGSNAEWEYALTTCLRESEEVSGSTDEAMELSLEGMAVSLDKDL